MGNASKNYSSLYLAVVHNLGLKKIKHFLVRWFDFDCVPSATSLRPYGNYGINGRVLIGVYNGKIFIITQRRRMLGQSRKSGRTKSGFDALLIHCQLVWCVLNPFAIWTRMLFRKRPLRHIARIWSFRSFGSINNYVPICGLF